MNEYRSRLGSNQYRTRRKTGLHRALESQGLVYKQGLGLTRANYKDLIALIIVAFIVLWIALAYHVEMRRDHATDSLMWVKKAQAADINTYKQEPDFKDARARNVYKSLARYNSPLADYADFIVQMADKNAIDYTIVAAISGKESSFGKAIEPDSFNAWGYMSWDAAGKRHLRHFSSWKDGIEAESKLISEGYRLNSNRAIGAKYCPKAECSETWAEDVTTFAEQIAHTK